MPSEEELTGWYRRWPYLPTGKAFITPLIFTSICMLAAERIPRYHDLRQSIARSDLGRAVVDATPGLAFAPGQEGASENGLEPDLDLELGIGPEEITALLLYASFSSSPRSDVIARTAFEWTRGYLKVSISSIALICLRYLLERLPYTDIHAAFSTTSHLRRSVRPIDGSSHFDFRGKDSAIRAVLHD